MRANFQKKPIKSMISTTTHTTISMAIMLLELADCEKTIRKIRRHIIITPTMTMKRNHNLCYSKF